jgi:aromatic ring-cleaving dioxygenase
MPHAVASQQGARSMIEKTTQSVANLGYHAHIYYDPTRTRAVAERVCTAISEKFPV